VELMLGLHRLARTLTERADAIERARDRLDWSGAAALAAWSRFAEVDRRLRTASTVASRWAGILAAHVPTVDSDSVTALALLDATEMLRPDVPAPSTPARQVSAWWAQLGGADRQWLLIHRPDEVGGLDGVPVADRDTANRAVLARALDRGDSVAGLTAIEDRLDNPELPRAYLVKLSTDGDGQAIVAIGNPDSATDVLTDVPGAGADLATIGSLIDRADAVSAAATRLGPDHQLASVAWLGYDPPDGADAALSRAAGAGSAALDSFVDGLRATHDGAPSHNTVLGHSYGSLTVGVTARDRGLAADDLIFVGSPGAGVDRASELGLPADRIWSSTAENDPVQHYAPGLRQIAADILTNVGRPTPAFYGDSEPDTFLHFGVNPSSPAFGGHVFASDPSGGHNGYWQGTGLENIARIAVLHGG
jgi:hypothetical protein